ncbi:MarR family winged helix-turn-helix transcriptional regulator [Candidatus Bathyarchaeota archaeon]|nr:MarR family winged helix-turn-helix transcriptional regulator [Candidatus Bathyarchaeota archaeon]
MTIRSSDQPALDKFDERILAALYAIYPEGYGYNQLWSRAEVNKKVLDLRLSIAPNPKSLVSKGYVQVKKGKKPKSPWRITLTEKGRNAYIRHVGGKIEDAFRLVTDLPEERMREALRKIMEKAFNDLFNVKRNLANLEKLNLFLKALEEPYMDVANRPLRGVLMKDSGMPYYQAKFSLDRLPWWWIRDDALLAIEKGHWISPGRIRLLTTLGIRTEVFLSRHNKKWLNRLEQLGKNPDTEKDLEHKLREPAIAETHPEAFCTTQRTMWNGLKYF